MSEERSGPNPNKNQSMSPLGEHLAWRQRVDQEKTSKKTSLHRGIQLGYVSKIDIKDLSDEDSYRAVKKRQVRTDI